MPTKSTGRNPRAYHDPAGLPRVTLAAPQRAPLPGRTSMISLHGGAARLCDGLRRRDFLRLGALGAAGLGLPQLLRAEAAGQTGGRRRATSCILFFLQGGQSQIETFDMKPDAPDNIRGEFRPVATSVPGTQVCEHLPRLAR